MRQRDHERDAALGSPLGRSSMQAEDRLRPARDLDVARPAPATERLDRRLFGGEPGSEVTAGPGPVRAGLDLARPEEAVGETRPAIQGTLDPIDLDQVDPERRDARDPAHGVITADVVESLPSGCSWTPSVNPATERSPSTLLPPIRKSSAFR